MHGMHLKVPKRRWGFPGGSSGKESPCQCRRSKRGVFGPWVREIPWRRRWQPAPVFLPGKSHGQRRLVGYSPRGLKELDIAERSSTYTTHTHTQKQGSGGTGRGTLKMTEKRSGKWPRTQWSPDAPQATQTRVVQMACLACLPIRMPDCS